MRKPETGGGVEDARSPIGGGAGGEQGKTIEAGEKGSLGGISGGLLVPVALM